MVFTRKIGILLIIACVAVLAIGTYKMGTLSTGSKVANQQLEKVAPPVTEAKSEQEEQPKDTSTKSSKQAQIQTPPSPQSIVNNNEGNNSEYADKLNKLNDLQERQKQKTFMLCVTQDDLECYTWGEKCAFPGMWKQLYIKYNFNGNSAMTALQSDLDTYLTIGDSEYGVAWAAADLSYEEYKTGKMKTKMTEQAYKDNIDRINAVNKRLGIIYAKREYATVPQP